MGSTRLGVKQMVQSSSLVGGGLYKPNYEVWGPLWWSQNHHQVVVMAVMSAAQVTNKGSILYANMYQ